MGKTNFNEVDIEKLYIKGKEIDFEAFEKRFMTLEKKVKNLNKKEADESEKLKD